MPVYVGLSFVPSRGVPANPDPAPNKADTKRFPLPFLAQPACQPARTLLPISLIQLVATDLIADNAAFLNLSQTERLLSKSKRLSIRVFDNLLASRFVICKISSLFFNTS